MGPHPGDRAAANIPAPRTRWTDETLDFLLRDRVAVHPDDAAVDDPPGIHESTGRHAQRWTWSRLDQEVDRLSAALLGHGVRGGDTVAVQLPPGVELVQALLACWRIGATAMPLSVGLRDRGLTYRALRAKARTILTSGRVGPLRPAAKAVALPCFPVVLAWGPDVPDGAADLDAAVPAPDEPAAYLADVRVRPDDRAVLLWTVCDDELPYSHRDLRIAQPEAGRAEPGPVLVNRSALTSPSGMRDVLVPWLRSGCLLIHEPPAPASAARGSGAARIPSHE
jgi:acyl-CoA synthetase (AMP-forming)/AMP-acid ligase II